MGHYDSCYEADERREEEAREKARVVKESQDRERIRKLQVDGGLGMGEAKRIVKRENLLADIAAARTIDDIKALLVRII